ncbi:MAG: flagellar basal body rod protein FlgB [Ghiorsea sp.]
MSGLFTKNFMNLGAALSAREQAQTVISSNIANADTPNYRSDRRSFADFFEQKKSSSFGAPMARTNAKHLMGETESVLSRSVFRHSDEEQRMDGNTVDLQAEMGNLAENQLMHELNMKILQGRLSGIANAIKEGGR